MCICCGGRVGERFAIQKYKDRDGSEGLLRKRNDYETVSNFLTLGYTYLINRGCQRGIWHWKKCGSKIFKIIHLIYRDLQKMYSLKCTFFCSKFNKSFHFTFSLYFISSNNLLMTNLITRSQIFFQISLTYI